jgi:catechol 2,3-dioxygenase-like lactoylglutathione lyase family enzyme
MMRASTTVFTVTNVMESAAYYRDKLGFDVAFQYGDPTFYIGLCSGEVTLHLIATGKAPRPPGHGAVSIFVDDVDALRRPG